MDIERERKIDQLLANFIFGCNIPLSIVESKHFKALTINWTIVHQYKHPTRKTLSTTILDTEWNLLIL